MNLYHLRYFVTLAHLEHYTRAAELLSITQPSLSHAISSLEGGAQCRPDQVRAGLSRGCGAVSEHSGLQCKQAADDGQRRGADRHRRAAHAEHTARPRPGAGLYYGTSQAEH